MAEFAPGAPAPDAPLRSLIGEPTTIAFAHGGAPAALFFFKVDCPTCPVVLPVVERMHRAYGGLGARVIGISQDEAATTRDLLGEMTLPVLLDDADYAASRAFGIDTVPSLVLIGADGRVARVEEGWSRQAYNEISEALARASGRPYVPASDPSDGRPDWKPG